MYKGNIGFRKQDLVKGFMVFVLSLFIFTLAGCDSGLDYDDFATDHILGMDNIIEQSDSQYLVYYYGSSCGPCKTIKDEVLAFASVNDAGIKMYFIESASNTDSNIINDPSYIVDPITDVPMSGTPTIITVVNRRVVDLNVGPVIVIDLLEKIEEGSYGLID
jgi:thiol-disulfide isomerase/thioredoxin